MFPAAAVAILAAHGLFERADRASCEYSVLIVFSAVGMGVMVSATSLISLYVGLELQSLADVLASYRRTDERSAEAGLKYFVLGALASGILLYGISLLYGFTGTTSFTGVAAAFGRGAPLLGLLFGLVFLLAGLAFKISAVPFHMWTPDVYEGAPTPVTTFFASAPKVAAVLLSVRLCLEGSGPATDAWRQIVIFAALASIFLGAIGAYGQTNIKRCRPIRRQQCRLRPGWPGRGHAAGRLVGAVLHGGLCRDDRRRLPLRLVDEGRGRPAGRKHRQPLGPVATRPAFASLLIFMFSLAGVPPMFGFWPKLLVFNAAVQAGYVALAVAGILGAVIGAYYYLKIVKVMYLDDPVRALCARCAAGAGLLILLAALPCRRSAIC